MTCEHDFAPKKEAKPSLHSQSDGECSPDGSVTEMGEDFEADSIQYSICTSQLKLGSFQQSQKILVPQQERP